MARARSRIPGAPPSLPRQTESAKVKGVRSGGDEVFNTSCGSEIWFLSSGDIGVLIVIVFMRVLGADSFRPFLGAAPIGYGRGPGHRKDARILDREVELQVLAPIVAVDAHRGG
jgi:hypothetical protein